MKRGKRQVKQLQSQSSTDQHSPMHEQSSYFHSLSNNTHPIVMQPTIHKENYINNTSTLVSPSIDTPKVDEMDEKKRKIEELKKKYLKKNKPEEAKIYNQNLQQPNVTAHKQQPSSQSFNVNLKQKQLQYVNHNNSSNGNINGKHVPVTQPYQQKGQYQQDQKVQSPQQIIPIQEQVKPIQLKQIQKPPAVSHHQVPKPPSRHAGKNIPPPPPIKKATHHPLPTPSQQLSQPQTLNQPQTITTKPSPPVQNKPQPLSDISSKSQKQDDRSFAPPSLQLQQNDSLVVEERKVPPPPQRSMKDVLNKKLTSGKNLPKPPQRGQEKLNNTGGEENNFLGLQPVWRQGDTNNINGDANLSYINQPSKPNLPLKPKSIDLDDQYNIPQSQQLPPPTLKPSNLSKPTPNAQKFITQWLNSPQQTLKELFPQLRQVIEFYCLNKHINLQLASINPTFTQLTKDFIHAFMINNALKYTQNQKEVAQSLCLNFFYTTASQFTDIFLIFLLKLGDGYLQKYSKAFQDKLPKYLSKLILYKNLFLCDEINVFVSFCLQSGIVRQDNYLQFLMLAGENQQLIQFITGSSIGDLKYSLGILSYCRLNSRNKNLMPMYLKVLSSLQNEWKRYSLAEKILNHLKDLDIPQHLYQYTKQLKLKLLKSYQNNTHAQTESLNQPNVVSQTKDTGLFGLFNINKAIDKIKTQTEKALSAVQKQKKPQQEEKKDQIVYDPIRKRYIINGEIPQDEDTSKQTQSPEVKSKIPPPPPMSGPRKVPPPMPGKKPGARLAGNRYT